MTKIIDNIITTPHANDIMRQTEVLVQSYFRTVRECKKTEQVQRLCFLFAPMCFFAFLVILHALMHTHIYI